MFFSSSLSFLVLCLLQYILSGYPLQFTDHYGFTNIFLESTLNVGMTDKFQYKNPLVRPVNIKKDAIKYREVLGTETSKALRKAKHLEEGIK